MKIRLNNFDTAIYQNLHVFVISRALNLLASSTKKILRFKPSFFLEFEYLIQCCANVLQTFLYTLKIASSVFTQTFYILFERYHDNIAAYIIFCRIVMYFHT